MTREAAEPRSTAMVALGVFALLWAVARAHTQAVTGDEAESYNVFIARSLDLHWHAAANNHLLNTLLAWLSTSVFGLSALTLRTPALLGAVLYIVASYRICRLITGHRVLRTAIFVCLVYNPLLFDHYVAARGYGFAIALWMWAVVILAEAHFEDRPLMRATAIASVLLALSFTSSFAFAFFIGASGAAMFTWTALELRRRGSFEWRRFAAAAILPGLIVIFLFPSWTLLHWPRDQFFEGTKSMRETLRILADASTSELSPALVNPLLMAILRPLRPLVIPVLLLVSVVHVVLLRLPGRIRLAQPLARLGLCVFAALAISLAIHRLAFRLFHLWMPRGRLGLYIIPAAVLSIGILAAIPAAGRLAGTSRNVLTGVLSFCAIWSLLCLRLDYFYEWSYQKDVKHAFDVVAWYARNRGVREVDVGWRYHAAMSFYQNLDRLTEIPPFTRTDPKRPNAQAYVLDRAFERDFITREHLRVVYESSTTDLTVAIRP